MSTVSHTSTARRGLSVPLALLVAVAGAAVVSGMVNVVIAAVAHGAGAAAGFMPLMPPTFIVFTVVGTLAGVVGWSIIRSKSSRPAAILRWLVPTILILSFIPDILVGVSSALPGTTWAGVIGLMCMHVSVTVATVLSCRQFLPLDSGSR